jgi:hypothetical protein
VTDAGRDWRRGWLPVAGAGLRMWLLVAATATGVRHWFRLGTSAVCFALGPAQSKGYYTIAGE